MAFINPLTDIALAALFLNIVSQAIQMKFLNKGKMKQNQEKMKEQQKRMKELAKRQDQDAVKEMEKLEKEFLNSANETMQYSLKHMVVSTPVFLVAFFFLGNAYGSEIINLPFPVPWFGENWAIQMFTQTSWVGWYVLSAIIISIIVGIVIKGMEKVKK